MTNGNGSVPQLQNRRARRRLGLTLTGVGMFLFVLGADPGVFGLDNSEVIGFVQVTTFTIGLMVIGIGGTVSLDSLWPDGYRSIAADIGMRLAWTGFVIALASGMADVFGLGTRQVFETGIFFGHWQSRGVLIGEIFMIVGFFMMIPYRQPDDMDMNGDTESTESKPEIKLETE